jgi:hypothetical protein
MTSGIYSTFSDACLITSPGGTSKGGSAIVETPAMTEIKAVAFPNPFADEFAIDISTSNEQIVQVKIYDMMGKLIESKEVSVSEVSAEKIGAQYPSGIYNVVVTQGAFVKALRVIKR